MRTTLTIEDDVAVRLERLKHERGESFKAVVNDTLRRGLNAIDHPAEKRPLYRIQPVALGNCHLPNLDKTSAVLAYAEGEDHK